MIKAIIFDMDGLLIDSEPLWQKAAVEVYGSVGVPLTIEMSKQTSGLRADEEVEYWHKRYPWDLDDSKEFAKKVEAAVVELIKAECKPKPGVNEAVAACEKLGLPMAIASSSPMDMILMVVQKLGLQDKIKIIHSAHDEAYGKPHPAVYLSTAQELGVHPEFCLAFEDSANGVLAAKAARMKCIAIPEPESRNDKRFGIADIILHSLHDFTPEMLQDW